MEGFAELFSPSTLGNISLGLLVVVSFMTGWIAPKRQVDYLRQDRDSRVAEVRQEANEWRSAYETSEKSRELLIIQNRDLIDGLRTLERFFESLERLAERNSRDPQA